MRPIRVNSNVRNVIIVLVLAVAVDAIKGGQQVAQTVLQAISLLFLAVLAWIASRLYLEHRVSIESLGTRRKATLYGAVALAALLFTASGRMLASPGGTVAWLLLLIGAGYAVYAVFRSAREY